jgi:biopolymer transport protein TolR
LPSESAAQITESKILTISISKEGRYFVDDREVSFSNLESALKIISKNNSKQQIHLRADVDATYGKVSHVLAAAQRFGLSNIGFITNQE